MGQVLSDATHYSQAVRLPTSPPTIKTSGQGGLDPTTGKIEATADSIKSQVDQAFANIETVLKAAGSAGWSDVYLVRMFYVVKEVTREEYLALGGEIMRTWCVGHRPLLTAVEVKDLALEGMRVEIEVEAMLKG